MIDPDHLALVMRVARELPDTNRDGFFKHVADLLRPRLDITDADVRKAVSQARARRDRAA